MCKPEFKQAAPQNRSTWVHVCKFATFLLREAFFFLQVFEGERSLHSRLKLPGSFFRLCLNQFTHQPLWLWARQRRSRALCQGLAAFSTIDRSLVTVHCRKERHFIVKSFFFILVCFIAEFSDANKTLKYWSENSKVVFHQRSPTVFRRREKEFDWRCTKKASDEVPGRRVTPPAVNRVGTRNPEGVAADTSLSLNPPGEFPSGSMAVLHQHTLLVIYLFFIFFFPPPAEQRNFACIIAKQEQADASRHPSTATFSCWRTSPCMKWRAVKASWASFCWPDHT